MKIKHDRIQFITELVKGKDVIDVGGIKHTIESEKSEMWLHKKLVESANSVLGIDILEEDVQRARKLGYNFIYGNAERLDSYVDKKFDVCVAGELIEHLANPGLFLQSARNLLKEDGILIITTPNVFTLGNILRILKYMFRNEPKVNKEHKAWYCFVTIRQLLESAGFKVEYISSMRPEREPGWKILVKDKLYGNASSRIMCVAKKVTI